MAASRGARLLIVVEDPHHVTDRALTREWTSTIRRSIATTFRWCEWIERGSIACSMRSISKPSAREIDRTLRPASRELATATITLDRSVDDAEAAVSNVVGVLAGTSTALAREAVVIGAHYDHLGAGGRSLRRRANIGRDPQRRR